MPTLVYIYNFNTIGMLKKMNQCIFPINYPESVYKEIVNYSLHDTLELSKLSYYEVKAKIPPNEHVKTEVCVGLICCWLIDENQGTTNKIKPLLMLLIL